MPRNSLTKTSVKPTGLVLYYTFDELGNVVIDRSGNGNHGNIVGSIRTIGKIGGGIQLDGTDDYLQLPDTPSLQMGTKDFSWMMWIYPETLNAAFRSIIGGEIGSASLVIGWGASGKLTMTQVDTTDAPSSDQVVPLNTWSHVGVVFNSSLATDNLVYYFNSNAVKTVTWDVDFASGASSNLIGQRTADTHFFDGVLDEIRIYDYTLSANEVLKIYNDGVNS